MTKEIRGLHEAAYLLAVFAFLSQVLALVRDRAFAHFFGAGPVLDAYFAAFKIPDLLFAFLTLFISSFALIPLIVERGGSDSKETHRLIGSVLALFGVVTIGVSVLLFVAIPALVPLLFPGFSLGTHEETIALSRVMLLQPFFLGLSSVIGALVQASRKFIMYALAPIFYNVGIIVGALFFYPAFGTIGLGLGVVLGAFFHMVIQLIPAFSHPRIPFSLPRPFAWGAVGGVVRRSVPRALALSFHQFLMLGLVGLASLSAPGAVAAFSFAWNVQSVPLSIIGVSYAAALFPSLSILWVQGSREKFVAEVWAAVRHIVFWTAPAIALLIVLRAHVVRVVLGSGAFSWDATKLTAALLAAFVISLIAQAVMLVFSRGYYAAGRERVPILVQAGVAGAAFFMAYGAFTWFQHNDTAQYFFEYIFRIESVAGSAVVVIALAYSLALVAGSIVFGVLFARDFGFERRVFHTLFCSMASAVLGAGAAYAALQIFGPLLPTETFTGIFIQGAVAGIAGIFIWALTLFVLRSNEFAETETVARRIIGRAQ